MTVDISKIKIGDTATLVPLEVWATDDLGGLVYFKGAEYGACFSIDQIVEHHPKPNIVGVGEMVWWHGLKWLVCGTSKGYALIETEGLNDSFKVLVSELVPVIDDQ